MYACMYTLYYFTTVSFIYFGTDLPGFNIKSNAVYLKTTTAGCGTTKQLTLISKPGSIKSLHDDCL